MYPFWVVSIFIIKLNKNYSTFYTQFRQINNLSTEMETKFKSEPEKLPKLFKEPTDYSSNCLVPLIESNGNKTQVLNLHELCTKF